MAAVRGLSLLLVLCGWMFLVRRGSAPVTLVDNFDYTNLAPDLVVPFISDSVHISQEFTTGNHTLGYEFESIYLDLKRISTLSGFSVSIHDVSVDVPGVKLYQLHGPTNKIGRQAFSASPGAVIVLDANTKYFFVLSASAAPNDAQVYVSNSTSERVSVDGWSIADEYVVSRDGGNNWTSYGLTQYPVVFSVSGFRVTNRVASGKPVISGVAAVGGSLFADVSGVRDLNGLPSSFVYQWVRVDGGTEADISGATGSTYVLVADDVGKRLKVEVSFVDKDGYVEGPLVSDPTGLVYYGYGFNVSSGARNFWSDGKILYFTKDTFNLHAYNMSSGSRVTGKEFSVNYKSARGLWSDGKILWVSQPDLRIIEARELSDGSTVSSGYFLSQHLTRGNFITSIHSTGATMWVLMGDDKQIYAYDRSSKIRDSGRTINLSASSTPRSIWSDGETMWVSDSSGSVVAYRISSGARDFDKDLDLSEFSAQAIWSDGEVMWVGNHTGGVVRAYAIDTNPGFLSGVLRDVGNENPKGVWSDGVFMWVLDKDDKKVYAYRISDKSRVSYLDFGTLDAAGNDNPYAIWSDGVTMWVSDLDDGMLYAYKMSDKSRDSGKDFGLGSGFVPRGIWSDETTLWVVNSSASDEILAFKMSDKSRDSGKDFTGLNSASVGDPEGIWSDGRTMFVLDSADQKVYAFNVGDKSRVSGNDFDLASGNGDGGGIWSHGGTMWVTDAVDDMIYAYSLPDSVVVPVNNLPVFSSTPIFSVNENDVNVGTVVASDEDGEDSVVNYVVSGGVDRSLFSVTSGGVLTFVSAPDFESPSDSDSNNVYVADVTVISGTGSRVRNATQSITVTVGDVDEAPSAPSAPVLSSPSSTSLLVNWSAPVSIGPAISGYDVQYRQGTSGSFTDWSHSGTGRSTTITSLSVNTLYQVQVRARNDEGNSSWSATASFTTGSIQPPPPPPPPQINNLPAFTSDSTFLVNENSRAVGTVVASDSDIEDNVTGYRVSGGVDGSLFSFVSGSSALLIFDSAPDYEIPGDSDGDNEYVFEVEVTSGTGGRVRTATQSITVTVVDVGSPSAPSAPVLSSPSSTSLSVSWSAPGGTGPSISDYDVGYGQNSSGPFTDWPYSSAGRSATITGLNASTLYYVRVRAGNAEGSSGWSEVSNFTTRSVSPPPPPPTNNPPAFTSSSSFSMDENTFRVGTVVASDSDGRDSVTGYSVSGGVDRARFTSTSGGVLTF